MEGYVVVLVQLPKILVCNHAINTKWENIYCHHWHHVPHANDKYNVYCHTIYEFINLKSNFVTRETRPVVLVKHEHITLPEHLSSPPVYSGIRVVRSVVFCVVFCRSLFVPLSFFFWPLCCLSFIDWWYFQILCVFSLD